jgi:16S rRNA (cytidine1402-2'-O)-methyltransferase
VVPIPGPCAIITALCAAGIPCDAFTFVGFLPAKKSARQQHLTNLKSTPHTLVFYESTHRLLACLDDIAHVFGASCELVVAKELTKQYERFIAGNSQDIQTWLQDSPAHIKGEFVVMIPPRPLEKEPTYAHRLLTLLLAELPLKQAVRLACRITGSPKNELYPLALSLSNSV